MDTAPSAARHPSSPTCAKIRLAGCTAASRSIGPNAGREYQQAHDASVIGSMRSVDLSKTRVSGALLAEPLTERQRKAADKLRSIEAQVQRRSGDVGVGLIRSVLAQRRPLEATARPAGAASSHEVRSWGWLFRRCLDAIAGANMMRASTAPMSVRSTLG